MSQKTRIQELQTEIERLERSLDVRVYMYKKSSRRVRILEKCCVDLENERDALKARVKELEKCTSMR